jgi:RNAse (barnase) inhibitor barstar
MAYINDFSLGNLQKQYLYFKNRLGEIRESLKNMIDAIQDLFEKKDYALEAFNSNSSEAIKSQNDIKVIIQMISSRREKATNSLVYIKNEIDLFLDRIKQESDINEENNYQNESRKLFGFYKDIKTELDALIDNQFSILGEVKSKVKELKNMLGFESKKNEMREYVSKSILEKTEEIKKQFSEKTLEEKLKVIFEKIKNENDLKMSFFAKRIEDIERNLGEYLTKKETINLISQSIDLGNRKIKESIKGLEEDIENITNFLKPG